MCDSCNRDHAELLHDVDTVAALLHHYGVAIDVIDSRLLRVDVPYALGSYSWIWMGTVSKPFHQTNEDGAPVDVPEGVHMVGHIITAMSDAENVMIKIASHELFEAKSLADCEESWGRMIIAFDAKGLLAQKL